MRFFEGPDSLSSTVGSSRSGPPSAQGVAALALGEGSEIRTLRWPRRFAGNKRRFGAPLVSCWFSRSLCLSNEWATTCSKASGSRRALYSLEDGKDVTVCACGLNRRLLPGETDNG